MSIGAILSLNLSKKGALLTELGDGVRAIDGGIPALVVEVEEREVDRCPLCGDTGDLGPGEWEE